MNLQVPSGHDVSQTRNRSRNIAPYSGLCTRCLDSCQGNCEVFKASLRGREVIYPQPFGELTAGGDKNYPVDYSHLNIMGYALGAEAIDEANPERLAIFLGNLHTDAAGDALALLEDQGGVGPHLFDGAARCGFEARLAGVVVLRVGSQATRLVLAAVAVQAARRFAGGLLRGVSGRRAGVLRRDPRDRGALLLYNREFGVAQFADHGVEGGANLGRCAGAQIGIDGAGHVSALPPAKTPVAEVANVARSTARPRAA